mgnify:CR=1 FL=1
MGSRRPHFLTFPGGGWGIAPPARRNALKTEILRFASRVVYCFAQFLPFFVYFAHFQRDIEIFAFSLFAKMPIFAKVFAYYIFARYSRFCAYNVKRARGYKALFFCRL